MVFIKRMVFYQLRFIPTLFVLLISVVPAHAAQEGRMRVAVLDFAETATGQRASDRIASLLANPAATTANDPKTAARTTDSRPVSC